MNDHTTRLSVRQIDISLLLLLFAGGILLRLLLLTPTGFDGLYGQDAYAYYDFAGELRAALNQGRAPGDFFWPLGYPTRILPKSLSSPRIRSKRMLRASIVS